MSDERRCGIFWMMRWEKSRSFVCWPEMELLREMMHFFTTEMHLVKNWLANVAEPTGFPRRRNPWVSSTGMAGAVVSAGWGVVKNVAFVLAIDRPSSGLEAEMRGTGDVPLQEVRIYKAAKGCAVGFECVAEEFKIGEVDTGRDVVDIR